MELPTVSTPGYHEEYKFYFNTDNSHSLIGTDIVTVRPQFDNKTEDEYWQITRYLYGDEQSLEFKKQFIRKVCENESYRESCLDGTADWIRVDEIWSRIEDQLFDEFKFVYDTEQEELVEDLLTDMYEYIKSEVQENHRENIQFEEVIEEFSAEIASITL